MAQSRTTESSQLRVDQVCPIVERFFQQLSGVQLQKLKDGKTDEATIDMLAELLVELMVYLIDSTMTNVAENQSVTEESVASTLGSVVPEAFAQALGVSVQDPGVSSQSLTKMMSEEISKSINSSIYRSRDKKILKVVDPAGAEPVLHVTPDRDLQTEKNKLSVRILVEKLVTRIYKKAKVNIKLNDPNIIIDLLSKKIWAEVQGGDFDITPEAFKSLDKTVFKDLVEFWGCAELVLVSLYKEQPEIDHIVCTFTRHLMTPQRKGNAICRFFSSLGRVISKPFTSTCRRVSPF
ncbi:hypothetical protein ABVT39_003967 [Epinephelus coioides]